MIAIVENSFINSVISYYDYNGFRNDDKPISKLKMEGWSSFNQMNNSSKVLVGNLILNESEVTFDYFSLERNPKG